MPQYFEVWVCHVAITGATVAPWADEYTVTSPTGHWSRFDWTAGRGGSIVSSHWTNVAYSGDGFNQPGFSQLFSGPYTFFQFTIASALTNFPSGMLVTSHVSRGWTFPTRFAGNGATPTYNGDSYPGDTTATFCYGFYNGGWKSITGGYAFANEVFWTVTGLHLPYGETTAYGFMFNETNVMRLSTISPGVPAIATGGAGISLTAFAGPWLSGGIVSATVDIAMTVGQQYTSAMYSADCEAIYSDAKFSSIPCGTAICGVYNLDGTITYGGSGSPQYNAALMTPGIACEIGTRISNAVAVNLSKTPTTGGMSKAIVQPCAGDYCVRIYECPVVTCITGTSDGKAPIEIDPPPVPGATTAVYNACTCT